MAQVSYVPGTGREQKEMLSKIGRSGTEELFAPIPDKLRLKRELNIPKSKSEFEVLSGLEAMAEKNTRFKTCFRGAGAYRHYIPSAVRHLAAREEFVTAYTPYQAEMSQGVLQSIFEYQTMICELTGMDVSNAGVYDGAHAAAEAAAMFRDKKRTKTIVFDNVKPMTLETIKTYCDSAGFELVVAKSKNGLADMDSLKELLNDSVSSVYIEQPNFYGLVEDAGQISEAVHLGGAKLVMGCYPISLALLKTPAECGADAAVGEAQPLGMPLSFGGPYLGYMAVKKSEMRKLPGRIVGKTLDKNGKDAYVLTLQAREQHIRREKASSSICSNEALCALSATIYCAAMGKEGLREVASQCLSKAHYAAEKIAEIEGFNLKFSSLFFNEFVTGCPVEPEKPEALLAEKGILSGLPVEIENKKCVLWCVTECVSKNEIDLLVQELKKISEQM